MSFCYLILIGSSGTAETNNIYHRISQEVVYTVDLLLAAGSAEISWARFCAALQLYYAEKKNNVRLDTMDLIQTVLRIVSGEITLGSTVLRGGRLEIELPILGCLSDVRTT
jgi:hypothetical protein